MPDSQGVCPRRLAHDFPGQFEFEKGYNGQRMSREVKNSVILGLLLLASLTAPLSAQQYLQVTSRRANLRFAPTTGSSIVATTHREDIVELKDESGDWYHVRLFSGELRYLHKRLAREVHYSPEVPQEFSRRREIFKAFQEVDRKVKKEASRRYPADKNLKKNIEHAAILEDRYKLEVVHRFEVQAPLYRRIAIEGLQKGW